MGTIYDSEYELNPVKQQPAHYARKLAQIENLKDITVFELTRYFKAERDAGRWLEEVPTIEKYKIGDPTQNQDASISAINVIRQLPDMEQKLPIMAITTATGKSRALGIGGQFVGIVQEPPRVETSQGPWVIPQNGQLRFQTRSGITTITFTPVYVPDLANVTPRILIHAINSQSNRLLARLKPGTSQVIIELKEPKDRFIKVLAVPINTLIGAMSAIITDEQMITVGQSQNSGIPLNATNADATTSLGLTVGQTDNIFNPERPPMKRYQKTEELTLNIDIGAEDDNQRTEITDLLTYFFELHLQERDYTFLGEYALGQRWQIVFKRDLQITGEAEIPRAEGDGFSKIYVNRISIPVTVVDYTDRPARRVKPTLYSDQISLGVDQ